MNRTFVSLEVNVRFILEWEFALRDKL